MNKLKIGLLPLYIELYDKTWPDIRKKMESFASTICSEFENRGIAVETAHVCRLEKEFARAIDSFEKAKVDALVTLHLAYSPSLESARVLANTKLPIIILDTTYGHLV